MGGCGEMYPVFFGFLDSLTTQTYKAPETTGTIMADVTPHHVCTIAKDSSILHFCV